MFDLNALCVHTIARGHTLGKSILKSFKNAELTYFRIKWIKFFKCCLLVCTNPSAPFVYYYYFVWDPRETCTFCPAAAAALFIDKWSFTLECLILSCWCTFLVESCTSVHQADHHKNGIIFWLVMLAKKSKAKFACIS